MKLNLVAELKETDALGYDLGKIAKLNNDVIKETLACFFIVLKQQ